MTTKNPKISILEQDLDLHRNYKSYKELKDNIQKYHSKYYSTGTSIDVVT
jgi:hypothetical protein